ncbi:beta-lactamase family protein [Schaalia sp. ZJ405]|uniref:serine hydrolase domain-containing protein n=1 Tax=Schaalia sp. ZJ405 TaxID=2709403 RepID=UPI0013EE18D4|nr:serine hydrolase domain-containing protein [Schaalia sp. ZJ405]QPK81059.1 beta-lactamase family protein [Schaalia sp. ZJ405]
MTVRENIPFTHSWALIHHGTVSDSAGDTTEVYPLQSVTKLLAAWSTLIAIDQGYLGLDDPVEIPGATVRHLLSHASGLPFDSQTPQFSAEKRRVYSNAGYDLLGSIVEKATGWTLSEWIDTRLLGPLGMSRAEVAGSPANSGVGSVNDLVLLANELAAPTLVSPDLAREATRAQFPDLVGIVPGYGRHNPCPWGLGPEIHGNKSPHWMSPQASQHAYGHFGVSGSFLWVDPDRDAAAVFLGEEPFGAWHQEHWHLFNDELITQIDEAAREN